ncbi:MAG: hypothetical protein Q9222_006677 [Ikaeria aurantiellina]
MTCVGLDLGMHLYFGDWHGQQTKGIADLTIWNQENQALIAGEVKTPWTVDLGDLMESEETDPDPDQFLEEFSQRAGQVAYYMKLNNFKYGFLTTYDHTVFFKQETMALTGQIARANEHSDGSVANILCYSRAIRHDTPSTHCTSTNPADYAGRVSLRECFLFLMKAVAAPGSHRIRNSEKCWTKKNQGKTTGGKSVTKLNPRAGSRSPTAEDTATHIQVNHSITTAQTVAYYPTTDRKYQDISNGADRLADKLGGLSVNGYTNGSASSKETQKVRVRWSKRSRKYIYTSGGIEKEVEKSTLMPNGDLWISIKGVTFLAEVYA